MGSSSVVGGAVFFLGARRSGHTVGSFGGDEGRCVLGLVLHTHGNTYPCRHFDADVLPET